MKLGAVMRSLFSNPAHREGEGEERNKADDEDERLVSRYAEGWFVIASYCLISFKSSCLKKPIVYATYIFKRTNR